VPVFVSTQWRRMSLPRLARWTTLLLAVWCFTRFIIASRYAGNPGSTIEYHLWDHVKACRELGFWILASPVGITALTWLIVLGWNRSAEFPRRAMVLVVELLLLFALFGFPFEWRVFYEAHAVLFALAVPGLARLAALPKTGAPGGSFVSPQSRAEDRPGRVA
jgi:hypothetical protein